MNLLQRIISLIGFEGRISSQELKQLVDEGAMIIDVRTVDEYSRGHAIDAINVPLDQLGGHIDRLKMANRNIVVYCQSGRRSAQAVDYLTSCGLPAFNAGGLKDMTYIT